MPQPLRLAPVNEVFLEDVIRPRTIRRKDICPMCSHSAELMGVALERNYAFYECDNPDCQHIYRVNIF